MKNEESQTRQSTLPEKKESWRTIWLSDIHLGTSFSKTDLLLDFLKMNRADQIILVGDIIDIWGLKNSWHWTAAHSRVIQKLIKLSAQGVRIVYIPGNHDELFRDYNNLNFGAIEIKSRVEYRTQSGKRLLVVHGDEYDLFMQDGYRWLAHLGDRVFHLIQVFSRMTIRIRSLLGKDYWSLAGYIKNRTKGVTKILGKFETALTMAAEREGYDGVICGHIHHAQIKEMNGLLYMNCGDWVDSCTALVEDHQGEFRIVDWMENTSRMNQRMGKKHLDKRQVEGKHV